MKTLGLVHRQTLTKMKLNDICRAKKNMILIEYQEARGNKIQEALGIIYSGIKCKIKIHGNNNKVGGQ